MFFVKSICFVFLFVVVYVYQIQCFQCVLFHQILGGFSWKYLRYSVKLPLIPVWMVLHSNFMVWLSYQAATILMQLLSTDAGRFSKLVLDNR